VFTEAGVNKQRLLRGGKMQSVEMHGVGEGKDQNSPKQSCSNMFRMEWFAV
jgi:hypothetical protein